MCSVGQKLRHLPLVAKHAFIAACFNVDMLQHVPGPYAQRPDPGVPASMQLFVSDLA